MIFRNTALFAFAVAIHRGLPVLLLPFLTRVLSVSDFGSLSIGIALVSVLALLLGLNPGPYVVARFHSISRPDLAATLFQAFLVGLVTYAIALVTVPLLPPALRGIGTTPAIAALLTTVALGRALLAVGLFILQMEKKAGTYAALSALAATLTAAVLGLAYFTGNLQWWSLFAAELLALIAVTAGLGSSLARRGYLRGGFDGKRLGAFLRFSVPLLPHALGLWAINSIDRFFLASTLGLEAVGIYSSAYMVALGLSLSHEAVQRALQPYFFEYLADGSAIKKALVVRYVWFYYLALVLLMPVYWLGATLILPFVLGPQFQTAMTVLPILIVAFTFFGMQRAVAGFFYLNGKTGLLATITLAAAVTNAMLNALLIPRFGIAGAAYATLASFLFSFLAMKIWIIRRSGLIWFSRTFAHSSLG